MSSAQLNVIRLARFPILNQLLLEEALLRGSKENWYIVNDGAFKPSVVMGISGRPVELVHLESTLQTQTPLLRRFTGGGTVVVDSDTVFATLIMQGDSIPQLQSFPQPIMQWTQGFYSSVFSPYGDFKARENDYVFGDKKFGGNAQAITGKRWLHHTSFLWDYQQHLMALLKHPPKAPNYRQARHHDEFVTILKNVFKSRDSLLSSLAIAPQAAGFKVQEATLADVAQYLQPANIVTGSHIVDVREHLTKQQDICADTSPQPRCSTAILQGAMHGLVSHPA